MSHSPTSASKRCSDAGREAGTSPGFAPLLPLPPKAWMNRLRAVASKNPYALRVPHHAPVGRAITGSDSEPRHPRRASQNPRYPQTANAAVPSRLPRRSRLRAMQESALPSELAQLLLLDDGPLG